MILNTYRICNLAGSEYFPYSFPVIRYLSKKGRPHIKYMLPKTIHNGMSLTMIAQEEDIMLFNIVGTTQLKQILPAHKFVDFFIEWSDETMIETKKLTFHHLN